jgi:hypothetical protein
VVAYNGRKFDREKRAARVDADPGMGGLTSGIAYTKLPSGACVVAPSPMVLVVRWIIEQFSRKVRWTWRFM